MTDAIPTWVFKFGPPVALAVLSGGIAMFGTVSILNEQLAQCKLNIERIEMRLESMHRDMYMPRWPQQ